MTKTMTAMQGSANVKNDIGLFLVELEPDTTGVSLACAKATVHVLSKKNCGLTEFSRRQA